MSNPFTPLELEALGILLEQRHGLSKAQVAFMRNAINQHDELFAAFRTLAVPEVETGNRECKWCYGIAVDPDGEILHCSDCVAKALLEAEEAFQREMGE